MDFLRHFVLGGGPVSLGSSKRINSGDLWDIPVKQRNVGMLLSRVLIVGYGHVTKTDSLSMILPSVFLRCTLP